MTLRRAQPFVFAAALLVTGGCKKSGHQKKNVASAAPAASGSNQPLMPATKAFCRILTLSGKVQRHGTTLAVGARVDGQHWLKLDTGAKLSLRHSVSAREFSLSGPGRALGCPHGEEQIILATGEFNAARGLGARPGAQVIVATQFGNVRYGNAQLDVKATAQSVDVKVETGDVWVDPIGSAVRTGPEHLTGGSSASLHSPTPISPDARVTACRSAAERAAALARSILASPKSDASGSLGARAAEDVRAREAARLACASAEAAVGSVADPAKRRALWGLLERSDRLWRQVPQPSSARGK
jgi:hypothetical protein